MCAAVDVLLVRKSLPAHPPIFGAASTLGSGYVSFNPKGRGAVLMAKLVELLPHAKHMLMYRDARKVTDISPESDGVTHHQVYSTVLWRSTFCLYFEFILLDIFHPLI